MFFTPMFDNTLKKLANTPVFDDGGRALAQAHNFHFDQRAKGDREQNYYRTLALENDSIEHLHQRHNRYIKEHVWNPPCPATFKTENQAAFLEKLEYNRVLIRVVKLDTLLQHQVSDGLKLKNTQDAFGLLNHELAKFKEKSKKNQTDVADASAMIEEWFAEWNRKLDTRPCFAAFEEDIQQLINDENWAEALRNQMGLSHLTPGYAPMYVALMHYTVGDVLNAAKAQGIKNPFAIPTVLDQPINEYFFPAPSVPFQGEGRSFGRTMSLQPETAPPRPVAELLHVKLDYKPEHVLKIAEIRQPIPTHPVWRLRNSHLTALRRGTKTDYGAEIPEGYR